MKKIKILPKKEKHTGGVVYIAGKVVKAGEVVEVDDGLAADLIFRGKAEIFEPKKSEK